MTEAETLPVGLIGREDELARLRRAADDAAAGAGRCMLVAGEPGIGKTRLAAELRSGFRGPVFEGRCYEEEASFAFAPVQAGLRALRQVADETDTAIFERQGAGLAPLLPELVDRAASPALADPGAAASQRALFEAAAGLLFDLAARRPLLVVFEDLHWSDESTLGFFRFIARRLAGQPVLLIGTYRPVTAPAPLAGVLLALSREPGVGQITLPPLSRSETDQLVRGLLGSSQPVSSGILGTAAAFSEGNPLYVEELVRTMIQAGDIYQVGGVWKREGARELRVPGSVQEMVRQRSETMTPEARRLLTVAAVAGREFDFEVLAEVAGQGETKLVAGLKELIGAGLISEERPDRFTFRHALLREAVLAELLSRERRALHARLADALTRAPRRETPAAELAYHYYEAEAWEEALLYARRAEQEARRLDATREALAQATRALNCAERLGLEPPLELLLERAELYDRSGEFDLAQADLAAALAEAERTGSPRGAWRALLRLGSLWAARDYGRTLAWLQKGLGAAGTLDDALARAETLNRIGNVYLNLDQPDKALPYHGAALEAFESTGDLAEQANTLELMAVCYFNLPDVLAGAACEERALALAKAADAADGRARSAAFHASIHLLLPLRLETEVGPPVDAERLIGQAEDALKLARGMDWPAGEAQALGLLGGFHGLLGQYGRGLAYLDQSLQVVQQLEHLAGISATERMVGAILLELMAYEEAAGHLRRACSSARGGRANSSPTSRCSACARRLRLEGSGETSRKPRACFPACSTGSTWQVAESSGKRSSYAPNSNWRRGNPGPRSPPFKG